MVQVILEPQNRTDITVCTRPDRSELHIIMLRVGLVVIVYDSTGVDQLQQIFRLAECRDGSGLCAVLGIVCRVCDKAIQAVVGQELDFGLAVVVVGTGAGHCTLAVAVVNAEVLCVVRCGNAVDRFANTTLTVVSYLLGDIAGVSVADWR